MKHLILDTGVVLSLWLGNEGSETTEKLLDLCGELSVKLWVSASALPTLCNMAEQALKERGVEATKIKNTVSEWMTSLDSRISILCNHGYQHSRLYRECRNFEDAQIAIAAKNLHGSKKIVTLKEDFDALGLIETFTPQEALDWIREETWEKGLAFIDLKAQQATIYTRIEHNILNVLTHGRYILGPEVQELEARLAEFVGVRHCIGLSSGTDALLVALMTKDIGPGDAVFTTPFTFIATAEVVSLLGATPVFVDIDPDTYNIDPRYLKLAVQAVLEKDPSIYPLPLQAKEPGLKPKAVIPVDLFGLPADYDPIMELAKEYDLFVLEDTAQGLGGIYKGRRAGSLGHAAATSFFPAKPLGCYGDGGALLTDDDDIAEKARSIRVHGKGTDKYDNVRTGLNARLHTMQAAILLAKLEVFPWEIKKRQEVAKNYGSSLGSAPGDLTLPHVPEGLQSVWAQYSVRSPRRDEIQAKLKEEGIPTAVYYSRPLHLQPVFEGLGYTPGDMPVSEKTSKEIFSLPMHPYLTQEAIRRIAEAFETIGEGKG